MSAENPTDVIEAVALAISKHRRGSQEAWDEDRRLARALADAGLLADPADRDVKARLIAHRNVLRRMNRAEAEVARLHSWEGLLELLDDHWPEDIFPTLPDDQSRDPGPRIVSLIRWVAELRATVDRVRALADEWTNDLKSYPNRAVEVRRDDLRAALDGGEQ